MIVKMLTSSLGTLWTFKLSVFSLSFPFFFFSRQIYSIKTQLRKMILSYAFCLRADLTHSNVNILRRRGNAIWYFSATTLLFSTRQLLQRKQITFMSKEGVEGRKKTRKRIIPINISEIEKKVKHYADPKFGEVQTH